MRQHEGHLLRILGIAFGLAAVVGSVIGQGILRSPGIVAEASSSPELIIGLWIGGGLITCLFGFAVAELGAAIPNAGGFYAILQRAFGPKLSVPAALASLVSLYASFSYLCFVVGEFLVRLGVGVGEISPNLLGLGAMALFCLINASGTRISGGSQILFSSLKAAVLLGLVVVLFANPGAPVETGPGPVLRNGWLPLGTAMMVVITTYAGWENVIFYSEEIENPGCNLPRAIFGGIAGVAVLYVAINLAFLSVLTPGQMAGSNLVAADAAGVVFGARGDFLLTCFGVLSVGAIGNLSLMTGTRFTYALARANILPGVLDVVGTRGTPIRAMLTEAGVGVCLILSGSYMALVSLGETVFLPVLIFTFLAVIALRRKEPDLLRPFRVPFYPYTLWLAVLVESILLLIYIAQNPFYALAGFVLVGVLWVVLWLAGRLPDGKPEEMT